MACSAFAVSEFLSSLFSGITSKNRLDRFCSLFHHPPAMDLRDPLSDSLCQKLSDAAEHYREYGYAVIESVLSDNTCEALRARMMQCVDDFDADSHRTVFKTDDASAPVDDYFMKSGDKIHFFFEDGAFDKDTGRLKGDKHVLINKAGHALHELDDVFRQLTKSDLVAKMISLLGYIEPVVPQSMYIFKQPGIGGEVKPHQDSTYLYTTPLSTVGFWFSIDDATPENGCLWAVPGSHKLDVKSRFARDETGVAKMVPPGPADLDITGAVCVPVPRGSLVLIHGSLVHYSKPNTSANSRHAYTLHVVESKDTVYSKENWLQIDENKSFFKLQMK